MKENEFYQELKKLGIILTNKQKSQLEEFYQLLIEANKKINLTTITNKEDVYLKHFYDSLTLVKVIDLSKKETLLDVGTGAGMPGIVLKIFFPNLKITLLDARNKKILYLQDIIKKLKLINIEAKHLRIEDLKIKYDVVVSRAVASLPKLLSYCLKNVQEDGCFIAMKANLNNEIVNSKEILKEAKFTIVKEENFKLPYEESTRNLIKFKKIL